MPRQDTSNAKFTTYSYDAISIARHIFYAVVCGADCRALSLYVREC